MPNLAIKSSLNWLTSLQEFAKSCEVNVVKDLEHRNLIDSKHFNFKDATFLVGSICTPFDALSTGEWTVKIRNFCMLTKLCQLIEKYLPTKFF